MSAQTRVAPATLSSWESLTNPKTPTPSRLNAYARFFATRRSLEGAPHLIPLAELDEEEKERFRELEDELFALHSAVVGESAPNGEFRRQVLSFEDPGPVVIICPEVPEGVLGPLAKEDDVNHNRLHKYADLDALLEIFGHLRALNPETHVLHRLPSDVQQAELQNHLVVLGGVGWNPTVRRVLSSLRRLPIEQYEDPRLETGEVFRVRKADNREERTYFPVTEEFEGHQELVEDVALLARLPNPFNYGRTLTICNGVHSKGVLGAVLTITDETVRPSNEAYLAQRFPSGAFAMLVRVPVLSGKVLAPDLQNPDARVFEWSPDEED
ncbi:hypothetical protein [Pseudonocardia lacus]|uniref:hypothetical protein n=1 Tax=Pseudonocardia lacus TaxID=2835865 RepID=UPI001BDC25C1|nr:hypothetical protein [Pseudonocardia lacus]